MTARPRTVPLRPWSPRAAAQLGVLSAAAFVYVTAELLPVGALPDIAADLNVSEALVGTLLAGYALVAAAMTVPLVRATAHWSRRRTLLVTLVCLTLSQVVCALAPDFTVLAAGRMTTALTHGLMWSVLAPIGVRLVPAGYAGRATTAVYLGTGLALVVGSPLTAALSQLAGWRSATAVIALAAAAVTAAARWMLPELPAVSAGPGRRRQRYRRSLVLLCGLTLLGVAGHFMSYTFIVVLLRDVVGIGGAGAAWVLAAYGVAGLVAMTLLARPLDRAPKATLTSALVGMTAAFAVLAVLATGVASAVTVPAVTTVAGVAVVVLWGALATAVPPMLQTSAIRTSPEDPDGASGLYVAAFQVGIMAGSLLGGLVYETAGIAVMVAGSGLLVATALAGVVASRGLFGAPPERGSA
ncbi:MFS transporter [Mycolicibacterium palauense]|uniref:MFS transporter n=1 Tax=Mycolicibacterium palauense TaxID=2034511 RepID=UPI000BFF0EB7|nr:MFS transporter [Mycolicibacterium palauense]